MGGNTALARRELLALLREDERDVQVLRQLAELAAEGEDWQSAITYQEKLVAIDGADHFFRDLYADEIVDATVEFLESL